MKNLFKYLFVAAAGTLTLAACQELEDFHTTIDAPAVLVYTTDGGQENLHTIRVAHAPVGSFGSYEAVFPVLCNSGSHAAAQLSFTFDEAAAKAYAEEHSDAKKTYNLLPAGFLQLEKYVKDAQEGASPVAPVLTLEENARQSSDSLKVSLVGDLTQLTERAYIAALSVDGGSVAATSEMLGTYYVEVLTEINCIRPLASKDDVVGLELGDAERTAEDGLCTIDLGETRLVTGLRFQYPYSWYGNSDLVISGIEYSVDGETWEQAGTPSDTDWYTERAQSGWNYVNLKYTGFYGFLKGRYVRFNYEGTLQDVKVYYVENEEPTLYSEAAPFSGFIVFPEGEAATSTFSAAFKVKVAPMSADAVAFEVAVDNSLIAAYNEANGTSFGQMDPANVKIEGATSIVSGKTQSEDVLVSLTGDLSSYTDDNGYLIPLAIKSSAAVSETMGVVYATIYPKVPAFKLNFSESDLGSWVEDRSAFSASINSGSNYGMDISCLFDGDIDTYMDLYGWNGVQYTVDLGSVMTVSGFCIQHNESDSYYQVMQSVLVEVSTDGASFRELDTASREDGSIVVDGDKNMIGFASPRSLRYIRLKPNYSDGTIAEFNVYTK